MICQLLEGLGGTNIRPGAERLFRSSDAYVGAQVAQRLGQVGRLEIALTL